MEQSGASQQRIHLFTAVLVLLIIIVAVAVAGQLEWAHLDYWKAHYIEGPEQIYNRSSGSYDEAAALALQRLEAARAPSSADHHRAATIIYRNIISQEHRLRAEADGTPLADDRELSRLRREMFGRARGHHMAALADLTNAAVARDEADRAIHRFGLPVAQNRNEPRGESPGRPGGVFIIDAALDFAFRGLETLLANDPLLAVLFAEEGGFEGAEFEIIPDEELAEFAQNRREASIQTRRAAAVEVAETEGGAPGARVGAYLDLSQRNTSDSQNSHDSSVNAAKRAIIGRLRTEQGACGQLPTLDQIIEEIRNASDLFSSDPRTKQPRPVLTEKAIAVVRRTSNGERSSAAAATDEEVLRRIWARANDGRNAGRRKKMRQACYDALVDSWERGIGGDVIQCVDGRISRMLGSLSWLDCDERNWEMRRFEQHKNEIFEKAAEIIKASAAEAANQNEDAALKRVGRSYLATTQAELAQIGAVDVAKEKDWIAATRVRIGQMVDQYAATLDQTAPGTVPKHAIGGIKKEACSAL
ncbi:hypothetical protein ElyMa_002524100 [Elysia marginata]|uniref:Uncharacterized protein n=1 Tax=Elysia marginata TaxID=1093978 RepID=A0AAV4GUV9_9GAST|nr:hypothetical protein ElyMa_002524100 [Elysia marginata]